MNNEHVNLNENLDVVVNRLKTAFEQIPLRGMWISEHWRPRKSGILELIGVHRAPNDITTLAKNKLFDTMFNAATQTPAVDWCAGLINNAAFTGYNIADTMASHGGWAEWTSYSQTTRVAWGQGAAASAAIANASAMQFDFNGTGVIRGLFVTTVNTKGGTTGLLWSAASYTSTVDVVPGDQIRSIYSLSC